jgi:hypothetical protein
VDYTSSTTITISWKQDKNKISQSGYTSIYLKYINTNNIVADMLIDTNFTFSCPAMVLQTFEIICITENHLPDTVITPYPETEVIDTNENPPQNIINDELNQENTVEEEEKQAQTINMRAKEQLIIQYI